MWLDGKVWSSKGKWRPLSRALAELLVYSGSGSVVPVTEWGCVTSPWVDINLNFLNKIEVSTQVSVWSAPVSAATPFATGKFPPFCCFACWCLSGLVPLQVVSSLEGVHLLNHH